MKNKDMEKGNEIKIAIPALRFPEFQDTEGWKEYIYNPQIEMFARFKMKSSFHKTKRII